jgi:hypothetical protein
VLGRFREDGEDVQRLVGDACRVLEQLVLEGDGEGEGS